MRQTDKHYTKRGEMVKARKTQNLKTAKGARGVKGTVKKKRGDLPLAEIKRKIKLSPTEKKADRHKSKVDRHKQSAKRAADVIDGVTRFRARQASIEEYCKNELGTDGNLPAVESMERRESCRYDLPRFLKTYMPQTFSRPFSSGHLRYLNDIADVMRDGGQKAVAMPRGSGKTSCIIGAIIWAALYGHRKYLVCIAATGGMASRLLQDVRANIIRPAIYSDFPEYAVPFMAVEGHTRRCGQLNYKGELVKIQTRAEFITFPTMGGDADGIIIAAAGLTGAIRGLHQIDADGNWIRPDFVLLDDPQTKESAESLTQTNQREEIVKADVLGLAGQGDSGEGAEIAAVCACTVISKNDLADRLLSHALNPSWRGQKEKLVDGKGWEDAARWKEYDAIWSAEKAGEIPKGSATDYFLEHREELEKDVEVFDPAMYSAGEVSAVQHCRNKYLTVGASAFAAEYQNSPLSRTPEAPYTLAPSDVMKKLNGLKRGEKPENAVKVVASVDVNKYALAWTVCGVSICGELSVMDYGWYKPRGRAEVWNETEAKDIAVGHAVTEIVDTLFASPLYGSEIEALCVDAGFETQTVQSVMQTLQRKYQHRRVVPSKGHATEKYYTPRERRRILQMGKYADLRWIPFGSRQICELMYDSGYWRVATQKGWFIPGGLDEAVTLFGTDGHRHAEYAVQVTAEKLVKFVYTPDQKHVPVFTVDGHNEMGDTLVMCAALASLGMGIAAPARRTAAQKRKSESEAAQEVAEEVAERKPARVNTPLRHRHRGNWATSW